MIWPSAKPMKYADTENETLAIVVFKSCAICRKAGKYISMENGVIAFKIPSIRIRKKFFLLLREYVSVINVARMCAAL